MLVELPDRFQVHPNQIAEFPERASDVFDTGKPSREPDVKELHAVIVQPAMKNYFFQRARAHRRVERKKMIDNEHPLPLTRQCQILERTRSSITV